MIDVLRDIIWNADWLVFGLIISVIAERVSLPLTVLDRFGGPFLFQVAKLH